ncbi:MAG: DUF975 family protein [Saccharofermentans sp.]|nr:DUF975 family protein [Saccharofermentans sp.]
MWTRKSVKQKGKKAFFGNFWKCVLVAIILSIVIGAGSYGASGGSSITSTFSNIIENRKDDNSKIDTTVDYTDDDGTSHQVTFDVDLADPASIDKEDVNILIGFFIVGFVVYVIIMAFVLAFKYLLMTPFEYGCRKFFRKNLDEPAKLSNIVYVFDSHYKNIVKTAFLTDLFIWLWSLLFIIPGIIKSYSYRLVPYIMSENPEMNFRDAQAESARLMNGNKWKSFVLDLSFIGWDILTLMTWGLLEIFFVGPYKASTDAALYESIKYGIDAK